MGSGNPTANSFGLEKVNYGNSRMNGKAYHSSAPHLEGTPSLCTGLALYLNVVAYSDRSNEVENQQEGR